MKLLNLGVLVAAFCGVVIDWSLGFRFSRFSPSIVNNVVIESLSNKMIVLVATKDVVEWTHQFTRVKIFHEIL